MWTPSDLAIWLPRPTSWTTETAWSPYFTAPSWSDNGDGYELAIELQGFRKRDVTVDVKGDVIEVRAEREPGLFSTGHRVVHHAITLPAFADSTTVRADFRAGRLVIHVEKEEAAKPRVIAIRVNGELPAPPLARDERSRTHGVLDALRKRWRAAVEFMVAAFRWPIPHD